MIKFNWRRLIITYLIFLGVQFAAEYLLFKLGISGLLNIVIISLILAVCAELINYPKQLRKYCLKDPFFYRSIAIFFLIFFAIDYFI